MKKTFNSLLAEMDTVAMFQESRESNPQDYEKETPDIIRKDVNGNVDL